MIDASRHLHKQDSNGCMLFLLWPPHPVQSTGVPPSRGRRDDDGDVIANINVQYRLTIVKKFSSSCRLSLSPFCSFLFHQSFSLCTINRRSGHWEDAGK